jgi:hypothetical protein
MANTKQLSREERKQAKRKARAELRKLVTDMSTKERAEFRKSEKGLKAFLAEKKAAAE